MHSSVKEKAERLRKGFQERKWRAKGIRRQQVQPDLTMPQLQAVTVQELFPRPQ